MGGDIAIDSPGAEVCVLTCRGCQHCGTGRACSGNEVRNYFLAAQPGFGRGDVFLAQPSSRGRAPKRRTYPNPLDPCTYVYSIHIHILFAVLLVRCSPWHRIWDLACIISHSQLLGVISASIEQRRNPLSQLLGSFPPPSHIPHLTFLTLASSDTRKNAESVKL